MRSMYFRILLEREPNKQFDFSKLALSSPININGGNHFIKYNYEQCPLYIKSPPCSIKQGIVTTAKRIFCDLMFTNENSEFIEYIENLEQYSQKYIYQNREKWFETEWACLQGRIDSPRLLRHHRPASKDRRSGGVCCG